MEQPEFWLRLARCITGELKASRDNNTRFLWVDGFDPGSVCVELERNIVTAKAWVYGGSQVLWHARIRLNASAVDHWRKGGWVALLPPTSNASNWLSFGLADKRFEILLGGTPSCNRL